MKAGHYLETHESIITEALNDYMRWFDKGEYPYKQCQKALKDLNGVRE